MKIKFIRKIWSKRKQITHWPKTIKMYEITAFKTSDSKIQQSWRNKKLIKF